MSKQSYRRRGVISIYLVFALFSISYTQSLPEKTGYCTVPGGRVFYRVVGSGEKPPIILLHGGPGGLSCSLAGLSALGDARQVILYDQLGSGRSDRPRDTTLWRIERFVQELAALVDHLHLTSYHLLGHSWGGSLAIEYMISAKPKGVQSMILAGPLVSTSMWLKDAEVLISTLPDSTQATIRSHEADGTTNAPEYQRAEELFYSRYLFHRNPPKISPDCDSLRGNFSVYKYMWGPSEFSCTGTLRSFDRVDRLHEISVPVLFVVGEYDEARPETVEQFTHLIPDSRLVVIPRAGHAAMVDEPEEYVKVLRSFLRDVESRK